MKLARLRDAAVSRVAPEAERRVNGVARVHPAVVAAAVLRPVIPGQRAEAVAVAVGRRPGIVGIRRGPRNPAPDSAPSA